jgi:hypothetical protein
VYVIVLPAQVNAVPVTGGLTENAASADDVFISSLNVAVITVVTGIIVEVGVLAVTFGAVVSPAGAVVKFQL